MSGVADATMTTIERFYTEDKNLKTVIMAGGRGTRISELFPDIPKPLIGIRDEI